MPPLPGQEEIERDELSRLFGHVVGARVLVLPALAGLVLWFLTEWIRFRRRGLGPHTVHLNVVLAILGHLVVVGSTGGLASPFLYLCIPLAIFAALFLGPAPRLALLGTQLAGLWGYAFLGATGAVDLNLRVFGGGARPGGPPAYVWAHAVGVTAALALATGAGLAMKLAFERTLRRRVSAQQESLRAHADRAEELTALSAEIAHELKNPLASVKGLAALLAQNVDGGKGGERLSVLRREVDRMQSILDEFLNFSRPLVPLALGETDVGAACREVAALHEGLSKERGVSLEVRAEDVPARCDPRKLKQVLINLVQNAIDASPAGAEVVLEAERADGGARVRVLDRGRGVDPAIGDQIFAPGVTTKPRGSGLGLTIARALARQHGGDLVLGRRDGGGTVAELSLPARAGREERSA
jgi:signal transduction histidine kinase